MTCAKPTRIEFLLITFIDYCTISVSQMGFPAGIFQINIYPHFPDARCTYADWPVARPGRKQANVSVRIARISFGALPCRKKENLTIARVSMLLKSRASLTCFRACFLPGRAKDLSAPRYLASLTCFLACFLPGPAKDLSAPRYLFPPFHLSLFLHRKNIPNC